MIEKGKVIKIDNKKNTATVSFDRKSDCEKCGMCLMSKDKMKVEITLKNKVNAELNDIVEVSMGEGFVLTSAIIVYLIPVILIGLSLLFTRKYDEIIQIISIGLSLLIGLLIAFIIDKSIRNRKGFNPEIINIIEKSKEEQNERE